MDLGRNVQWTGRQLEYNFTLPLVNATRKIYDLQTANQTAITRITKVYGDGTDASGKLSANLVLQGQAFKALNDQMSEHERISVQVGQSQRLLSDIYGVSIDEVSELTAMWAAAGLTGVSLMKQVKLSLETMMVGDFSDSEDAFEALIALQSAYQLSTSELEVALAKLNTVENMSAAQFGDLIVGISKAGSSAQAAGVSIEQLAAYMTLLRPATGSAETAGNALKTIFSRILVPTTEAAETLGLLGINLDDVGWKGAGAATRLEILAQAYEQATDGQKAFVSAHVAGRYQLNKFDAIMAGIINKSSIYHQVLAVTVDAEDAAATATAQYRAEIAEMLNSTPRRIEIAKTSIMNLGSQLLIQLLPAILGLLSVVQQLVHWFSKLNESTRQWVLIGIVILATIGPVMRLIGAFMQLAAVLKIIGALLVNPWVLLAVAVIAAAVAAYVYRDEVVDALTSLWNWMWGWIKRGADWLYKMWGALPKGIKDALMAAFNIIKTIGQYIWKALQALNPFARHSPSLVDNVIAGVDLIARKYASLANIGNVFRRVTADMAAFGAATAGLMATGKERERNEIRADVGTAAPAALPALENLFGSQDALVAALALVKQQIDAQKAVLAALDQQYDDLSRSIDVANAALDEQRELAAALKEELDAAQAELDRFAQAPIEGMGAMSDAIFENDMAVKALRLAMMDMEDAIGPIDDIKTKMASLAGEIEQLQGIEQGLRASGAGSEITGPIRDRIAALQDEAVAVADQLAPYNDLEDQLKALGRVGERLNLEQSLRFDPLARQVDKLTNSLEELPFDEIIKGIHDNKTKVNALTKAYDEAEERVKQHETTVRDLEKARDDLKRVMDVEQKTLDELQLAYESLDAQLRDVEAMLNDIASAARDLVSDLEDAADAVDDLSSAFEDATGDFEDVLGTLEDELGGSFEQFIKDLEDEAKKMFDFDIWANIKKWWQRFKDWWNTEVVPVWDGLASAFGGAFDSIGRLVERLKSRMEIAWKGIKEAVLDFWEDPLVQAVWTELKKAFEAISKDLKTIKENFEETTDIISEKLGEWKDDLEPVKKAFNDIGEDVTQILGGMAIAFGFFTGSTLTNFNDFDNVLRPNWNKLWEGLNNVLGPALTGMHGLFFVGLGLLSGDFNTFASGILKIWSGLWGLIERIFNEVKISLKKAWDEVTTFFTEKAGEIKKEFEEKIPESLRTLVTEFQSLPGRLAAALLNIGPTIQAQTDPGLASWVASVLVHVGSVRGMFSTLPGYITLSGPRIMAAAMEVGEKIRSGLIEGIAGSARWIKDVAEDLAAAITLAVKSQVNNNLAAIEGGINKFVDAWNANPLFPDVARIAIPRWYHQGGLVTGQGDVPAILEAGEYVLSRATMAALGRAGSGLPRGEGDSRAMVFYGDLSFPNITNGDDAEKFLRNLEALAVR